MNFVFYFALTIFVIVCAVLCLTILVQESKSFGLGSAFGGDAGDSLFGTSTADVLKKFTAWVAAIFAITCIILSFWSSAIAKPTKERPTTISFEEMQTPQS